MYRLADEPRAMVLIACHKCEWRAAFERRELIAAHGADCPMPSLLDNSLRPAAQGSDHLGIGSAFTTSSRSNECKMPGSARLILKRAMPIALNSFYYFNPLRAGTLT